MTVNKQTQQKASVEEQTDSVGVEWHTSAMTGTAEEQTDSVGVEWHTSAMTGTVEEQNDSVRVEWHTSAMTGSWRTDRLCQCWVAH